MRALDTAAYLPRNTAVIYYNIGHRLIQILEQEKGFRKMAKHASFICQVINNHRQKFSTAGQKTFFFDSW